MATLVRIGLCELALGALLGWAVLLRITAKEALEKVGVKNPRRILQAHLDYIMMGLILIAVGLALAGLADWNVAAIAIGTLLNPTLFLPLAWNEALADRVAFRGVSVFSFVATSGGLLAAAVEGLSR
jgi:hypothetical protein